MRWRDFVSGMLSGVFRRAPSVAILRPQEDMFLDLPLTAAPLQEAYIGGAGILIDTDDNQFRRLSTGQRFKTRDLTPIQQDRMLEIAWFLMEANPFAKRLIELMRDLVVGEGITVSADDERIDGVLQRTWTHPVSRFDHRIGSLYYALSLNGELVLPAARNPITGLPHIGYIDPMQVDRVEHRADNVLVHETVVLKPAQGAREGARLKVINEDPVTGLLEGDVFYFPINALPNATRGRSDLLALADWLDLYDQLMYAEIERVHMLSSFVWDLLVQGESNAATLKAKADALGTPKPGTVYAHNEKETLEARTPDLKAADRSEVNRMLAIHIAGSAGYPITWLGFPDSTRATLEGQNDVATKTPARRQKEFVGHLRTILRYAIEGATTRNRSLYRGAALDFDITVPEIATKDIARVGTVIGSIVQACDVAQQNGTMSKRASVLVQLSVMRHLGVDLDVDEVIAQAEAEQQERQVAADERAALVAKARAVNEVIQQKQGRESPPPTNPPLPPDEGQSAAA